MTNPKPLWRGPSEDGITYSLLNNFLECRERFRLKVVHGIVEDEGYKAPLEYGSMWHVCEEAAAGGKPWKKAARRYVSSLRKRYPESIKEISKWYQICLVQFPIYLEHWKRYKRSYVLQETPFAVEYRLPSGRGVLLRGMWDALFTKGKHLVLQENKTKGDIDETGITQSVHQNMQTMFYMIALKAAYDPKAGVIRVNPDTTVPCPKGCRVDQLLYNVVRRPLAGTWTQRFRIRQRQGETLNEFHERLGKLIQREAAYFFHRWDVSVSASDFRSFQRECFDPILEHLCSWWDWIAAAPDEPFRPHPDTKVPGGGLHYRTPFGLWSSLAGGFRGSYFEYMTTGSTQYLTRTTTLFPELEDG